mmetsp:Transcript_1368/g.2831  ORF Transcript_1368/g.2831 Transcript_1368/m.2831 type:complete len:373 (-) Transcript_1368:97-1215(-)
MRPAIRVAVRLCSPDVSCVSSSVLSVSSRQGGGFWNKTDIAKMGRVCISPASGGIWHVSGRRYTVSDDETKPRKPPGFTGCDVGQNALLPEARAKTNSGDGADREQRAKSKPRLSLGADESAWELQAGIWPNKERGLRTQTWGTLHFRKHLQDDSLQSLLSVLRKLSPGTLSRPLAFNHAQNFVLMLMRAMLTATDSSPEDLAQARGFMLDCVCHIAEDEVIKLGPHPFVVRLWLEVALSTEHETLSAQCDHVKTALGKVNRIPGAAFTYDDTRHFIELMEHHALNNSSSYTSHWNFLKKIEKRFEKFLNSNKGQDIFYRGKLCRPRILLNFHGGEMYRKPRLKRTRMGRATPTPSLIRYRLVNEVEHDDQI